MISNNLKKNLNLLNSLVDLPENIKKKLILTCGEDLIIAICELTLNLLNKTFSCTPHIKNKLKKYKRALRKLASRKKLSKNCNVERKLINQRVEGVSFLNYIIPSALKFINEQFKDEENGSSKRRRAKQYESSKDSKPVGPRAE